MRIFGEDLSVKKPDNKPADSSVAKDEVASEEDGTAAEVVGEVLKEEEGSAIVEADAEAKSAAATVAQDGP